MGRGPCMIGHLHSHAISCTGTEQGLVDWSRLARLSEGRIEPKTGNLMCSYHGWQFNGQGQCTAIPQAESAAAEQKMCANSNSCVKKFPVKVSLMTYSQPQLCLV